MIIMEFIKTDNDLLINVNSIATIYKTSKPKVLYEKVGNFVFHVGYTEEINDYYIMISMKNNQGEDLEFYKTSDINKRDKKFEELMLNLKVMLFNNRRR